MGWRKNILTEEEAVQKTKEILDIEQELILKPALESGCGQSISFLNSNMSREEILTAFKKLKTNYVCQKIIKNHPSYAAPNKNSLNTLRICTIHYKDEILLAGSVFRMGISGRVDNWGAGGLLCKVDEFGVCGQYAVTEKGKKVFVHPNGFEFAGHKLYRADEAQELAKKCHKMIPQQKYISWDFTVDDMGELIFIEMNSPGGTELIQSCGMNAYVNKEIAKEIFDDYFINRFFYVKANYDWNYREFSDHVSLLQYAGDEKDIVVPQKIEGKEVRIVYADAFKNVTDIEKITIPKTIFFNEYQLKNRNIILNRV